MKFLSAAFGGLALLGAVANAHPAASPFDEFEGILERSINERASYLAITGVSDTTVEPRYEITQLRRDHSNMFSLFILAMKKWQAQAQSKETGYYQVAGIHGVPRVTWNNADQCSSCSSADGYCTHNTVLFPAWHRAYMALFEQQLYKIVNNIANDWPTSGALVSKASMKKAATKFRMPYWDWAADPGDGTEVLVGAIASTTITINGTTGEETIKNPLFKHTFTSEANLVYSPFVDWSTTKRYPSSDDSDATSVETSAVSAFANNQATLQSDIYDLLTACDDYLYFSTTAASSDSCPNSLEGIHNTVHTLCGGPGTSAVPEGGHMTYLSLAAFDPIFWLHHGNVDRIFALWQTLHPDSYGASLATTEATWVIPEGTTVGASYALEPFSKNTAGDYWTTNSVRDWESTFHYTYPEFLSGGSESQIASYVNALYGPSATATAGSTKRSAAPEPVVANARSSTTSSASVVSSSSGSSSSSSSSSASGTTSGSTTGSTSTSTSSSAVSAASSAAASSLLSSPFVALNGSNYQYLAKIKTTRHTLGNSFTVYIFNGEPTTNDTASWLFESNLIGPMAVLSMPRMAGHVNTTISGSVSLTRTLQQAVTAGTLTDLTEANAAAWLKKNLEWRIVGPNGTEIAPSSVPGFKVSVLASTSSALESEYDLPVWSDFYPLVEATRTKAGGLGSVVSSVGSAVSSVTSALGL